MKLENIGGILVLYQCGWQDSITLQSLNRAAARATITFKVTIYDNSPNARQTTNFTNLDIIEVVHNANNPGVSAAYNHFAHRLQEKFAWLLLLDQDTEFPENYFEELKSFLPEDIEIILPGLYQGDTLISPHAFKNGYSHSIAHPGKGVYSLRNRSALNSGILLCTSTFLNAGGYAEDVPLYFSDQVFIHKLKNNGLRKYYLLNARCRHNMASNDDSDGKSFRQRYLMFINGAKAARPHFGFTTKLGLNALVLLRGLKLSLRHNNLWFLRQSIFAR